MTLVLQVAGSSVLFFGLPLLQGRCASGLRCLVPTWAALFVQSQQPFVVGSHSAVNVCPTPGLVGQVVWSLFFCTLLLLLWVGAPLGSLLQSSVPLASCRTLSFCCFLPGIVPLAFYSGLGFRAAVLVLDPPFFFLGGGGGSLSLILVVLAWLFQLFCCPGSWGFRRLFAWFLSSLLPVFTGSSG